MKIVEEVETPYNDVDVWETDYGYDFEVAGGTHATFDRSRFLTGYAWDAITAAVMLHPRPPPRNLLMLGLGGGTALRQIRFLLPECHITAVEIDPVMVDLARRYMQLDALDTEVVVADAYELIKEPGETYDVIIDDVYLGVASGVVRPAAYTRSLVGSLKQKLTPNGVTITNVITGHGHTKVHKAAREAYAHTFPQVLAIKPPFGYNVSFVGGRELANPTILAEYSYLFENPTDIREWEKLSVRRVSSKF